MPRWLKRLASKNGPRSRTSKDAETEARTRLIEKIAASPPWTGTAWDPRVLEAIARVPRRAFAPSLSIETAYADEPQSIGHGQTISQPTMVALMTQALSLTGAERVLEIGTGSGYQAAVLAGLASQVHSIERIASLSETARGVLEALELANIELHLGDGYLGLPDRAPFDRIVLTAAPETLPTALLEQLAEGGILLAPVGRVGEDQTLLRVHRKDGADFTEDLGRVRFVPML